uniref:SAP domain-containing protein n=1 Tax=Cyprinus carpio carpio TaxID=630221 RepID=A0A9J7Y4U2_CYPCA
MAEHTVEQGKEEEKEKHISIQRGSALPLLIQCTTCCRNFHCPFCDASIFKPTRRNKLTSHMKIHFKKAVVHGDFTFHRCGLGCRQSFHFHCLYCTATILRKLDFHNHLEVCKGKPLSTSTVHTTGTPSATSTVHTTGTSTVHTTGTSTVHTTGTPSATSTAFTVPSRVRARPVIKQKCPICNTLMNKKNIKKHIDRKHTNQPIQDINARFHLASQCVDKSNGIFTVLKVASGQNSPLHVQNKTWGEQQKVCCESNECQVNMEVAQRSGMLSYQCMHVRSVSFCTSSAEGVSLKEDVLTEMVRAKWFGDEKKNMCLARQQLAVSSSVPLSVETSIGSPQTKKFISVFEPNVSYYSRLGRVIVVYNTKLNTWHCPCSKVRRSCPHKYIAKWHLFQTDRELFRTVFSREESPPQKAHTHSEESNVTEDHPLYPPNDLGLKQMVQYILQNKMIPAVLPDNIRAPSLGQDYPKYLCPEETVCHRCPGVVPLSDPILITKRAKILSNWCIVEEVSTYCKQCPLCGMFYRYQEWKDQLHNFNDHIILDIHLCLILRNLLQAHTAVSRAVEFLQDLTGLKYPPADTVLHAYLHFEALTDHEYKYSCITCGDHPPVVIMDLHKKGVFHLSVSDIQGPAENFDGEVNLEKFWETMSCDMIGRGFVSSGRHNPCAVSPTYHFWAPWIGKATRRSDSVLNTEFEKIHVSKSVSEISEITVTEERLREELYKQKVVVIRKLCKECGLDSNGSRSDLLLRLSNEMKSRQTYDKIFDKIWGASGGWAVIMCPCGIVYSIKCNLQAESPRDFADLLLSWKHMPNVIIYDFARGLATHLNLRASEKLPISPFEGRLAEPIQSNIELAKCGKLKVSLPWLNTKKTEPDLNGHPVTGSSDHYVLYDRFHEANTKDSKDVLRKLTLVPQLAGKVNSQVAEQLFAKMKKNNYFLNMSLPSTHLFQMRNIIHHYNEKKNNKLLERLKKTFGGMMVKNVYGQAVFGNPCFYNEEAGGTDVVMEDSTPAASMVTTGGMVCDIKQLSASRSCWDFQPSDWQSSMLNQILSKNDRDETIAQVGSIKLQRKDFLTLGLNAALEATIANSCLDVIVMVAKEKVFLPTTV